MSAHMEKKDEADNFDEKNFENLVKFHEEELRRILQGENPSNFFTGHTRGKLRDAGILNYKNRTWVITDRAMKYLLS